MLNGFSKLTKEEKRQWLLKSYFSENQEDKNLFSRYDNADEKLQKLHDEFIENTIANYYLPLGVAPNFLINNKLYTIPMAIEESSVVAAVSKAAKFWAERGGFQCEVISTEKNGQVHFFFEGEKNELYAFFEQIKSNLYADCEPITANMQKRGGGITSIELIDKTAELSGYYQIHATFETLDAMGANFINSCLEQMAQTFENQATKSGIKVEILMSILSNYVPNCLVRCEVTSSVKNMNFGSLSGEDFCRKFVQAIAVANAEPHRAVTHNKGVMNGVDAVILATGNDFRAVEAGIHAYACRSGRYRSLTYATLENETFTFGIEIPLAIGTIGGLTNLHPMVKTALQILENPSAGKLMQIVAAVGLAQNFAAVSSLITSGIQKGHMKMHLLNILNQLGANEVQKQKATEYFKDKKINHTEVANFLVSFKG